MPARDEAVELAEAGKQNDDGSKSHPPQRAIGIGREQARREH